MNTYLSHLYYKYVKYMQLSLNKIIRVTGILAEYSCLLSPALHRVCPGARSWYVRRSFAAIVATTPKFPQNVETEKRSEWHVLYQEYAIEQNTDFESDDLFVSAFMYMMCFFVVVDVVF